MPRFADHLTGVADILATSVTDGEVRANIGDALTGKGIAADAPFWQQYGFASRPSDPDSNGSGACMALYIVDGNTKRIVATRDNRFGPDLSQLKTGESMMFGDAGQFFKCHQDGGASMFTTDDGTPTGRTISFQLIPTEGLVFESPWCRLTVGALGLHFIHSSGARLDLGAIGGLPEPLDVFGSMAQISAGILKLDGGAISLGGGPTPGLANELSVAALVTILGQIVQAISVLAAPAAGPAALTSAGLPANGVAAGTAFTPLLQNIGKPS